MIQVQNLRHSFGEKTLYENVSFVIGKGQKVGLAGPNGSGKSTLLKILTGAEELEVGNVKVLGSIAMVPQEVKHDPIMEESKDAREYIDPENNYQDFELLIFLSGLELDVTLAADPKKFSGGQKTKLALARALLAKPDVLLLDEPTNFMDIAGKKWVMDFLSDYFGTVIVISHDLELMNNSITKMLVVNPPTRTIEEYKGNYSTYIRLKKEKEELLKREIQVKQQHIARMEKGLKKMARANRFTKAKIKQIDRIEKAKAELPDMPPEIRNIKIHLPEPVKGGELLIRTIGISKSYGDLEVLKDVKFTITRGERIALIGPNGVGKSTFIKIILGMLNPDGGEVIADEQLKVGYYSQEFETLDFQKRVLEIFTEETEKDEKFSRAFLGRYMFLGDKVFQKVESLSGGEKTRLSIAILTARDSNLLVLDEPTTYLDVMSQRIILESLKEYKGTMIFVSHTPDFVKEMAPQKAFLFPEEKMVYWRDDLLDKVEEF